MHHRLLLEQRQFSNPVSRSKGITAIRTLEILETWIASLVTLVEEPGIMQVIAQRRTRVHRLMVRQLPLVRQQGQ